MSNAGTPIGTQRGLLLASLVVAYAASVLFSILISRTGGQTASVWTATGFLAAALILLPGRWRYAAAALCVAIQAAIGLALGDGPIRALISPPINLLAAGLAAWLAVNYCGARRRRLSLRKLTLLVIGAIAPAVMLSAVFGALADNFVLGRNLVEGWLDWVIPNALGMVLVTPSVLLVARESQYKEFRRSAVETGGLVGGVCGLAIAVFWQSELPLHFVIFPALTLVAFRLGPPGAAVTGFFAGVIGVTLAALGHGPVMLATVLDQMGRVRLTQVVAVTELCTSLATAVVVADHSRLQRLLIARDRAVRAALMRARVAERMLVEAMQPRPAGRQSQDTRVA